MANLLPCSYCLNFTLSLTVLLTDGAEGGDFSVMSLTVVDRRGRGRRFQCDVTDCC